MNHSENATNNSFKLGESGVRADHCRPETCQGSWNPLSKAQPTFLHFLKINQMNACHAVWVLFIDALVSLIHTSTYTHIMMQNGLLTISCNWHEIDHQLYIVGNQKCLN